MTDTIIVRLPTAYLTTTEASYIIDNLFRLGLHEIAKDAIWNTLHVYRWCEGDINQPHTAIEKHFDYAEFWEWISDRYDDPYQLALCRIHTIHDVALRGIQTLMLGLLMEWRFTLPLLPFERGMYANVVDLRSDRLEATVWFECTPAL